MSTRSRANRRLAWSRPSPRTGSSLSLMPDLWMPEAIKVPGNNGLKAGAGGGKGKRLHTHHTFEAGYTLGTVAACRYLNSQGSTSHFTFNPVTGEIGQMLPMNEAARTLRVTDPRTGEFADVNRYGDVHAQTEVIAYAARPWTLDLTAAGMRGLILWMNFLRSWGIPDQWAWAGQAPPAYPGGSVRRRWPDQSGHAYHSGWPVNDHGDPGAITAPWTLVGTPARPQPPRQDTWPAGWISHAQELLAALGYYTGEVDDSAGPLTEAATTAYQADHGLEPDGKPGALTTAHLEDTMSTLPESVASAVWGRIMSRPGSEGDVRADTFLRYTAHRSQVDALAAQVAEQSAQIAALAEALRQGTGGSIDLTAVQAAATRGATDALAGYTLRLEQAETDNTEES